MALCVSLFSSVKWDFYELIRCLPKCLTYDKLYIGGVKFIFMRGHISFTFAFEGPNVILGLSKCNYSLIVKRELSTAAREKQGTRPDKTRWRALCLPPVLYINICYYCLFHSWALNAMSRLNTLESYHT